MATTMDFPGSGQPAGGSTLMGLMGVMGLGWVSQANARVGGIRPLGGGRGKGGRLSLPRWQNQTLDRLFE